MKKRDVPNIGCFGMKKIISKIVLVNWTLSSFGFSFIHPVQRTGIDVRVKTR